MLHLETIIFVIAAGFLLRQAVRPTPGFATWHMFTRLSRCDFELTDKGVPFNRWQYLPHTHIAMSESELDFFLFYLREVKGLELNGRVKVTEGFSAKWLNVRDSHVVA